MNIISQMHVEGLWGRREADLTFFEDVNFLIGPNGSGKTTLVDILAAVLTANRRSLERLPFNSCNVVLRRPGSAKQTTISVERSLADSELVEIIYRIMSPDGTLREMRLRDRRYRNTLSSLVRREVEGEAGIVEELAKLIQLCWVSVARAAIPKPIPGTKSYETSVDVKLDEVKDRFVRYAGRLLNHSTLPLTKFIRAVFLSLVDAPKYVDASSVVAEVDLQTEQATISEMLDQLQWLRPESYSPNLNALLNLLQVAQGKMAVDSALTSDEIGAVFALSRLRTLEDSWRKVQTEQERIMKPVKHFLLLLNDLFVGKKLEKTDSNELIVTLEGGGRLDLQQLSSGEKQMVILLGEALLQKGGAAVYVADEPELSLHVAWQEKLVSNIRELNNKAQLIFATHSPDIVSVYGKRTLNVGAMLR